MLLLQELTPHMLNVEIFFMIQLILIWYTTINDTVNLRDQPKFGEKWKVKYDSSCSENIGSIFAAI